MENPNVINTNPNSGNSDDDGSDPDAHSSANTELVFAPDSPNLELIYKDTEESIRHLRGDITALNTRLSLLIGFDAAFTKLLMNLPGKTACVEPVLGTAMHCYSCQWLRAIALVLAVGSIAATLRGLYPNPVGSIISPNALLQRGANFSPNEFKIIVIEQRDKIIRSFINVSDKKARGLKIALTLLGAAASATAIDLLISSFC